MQSYQTSSMQDKAISWTAWAKAHGQKQIINLYSTKLSTNISKMFFLFAYRECSEPKVEPSMFEGDKKNPQQLWPQ